MLAQTTPLDGASIVSWVRRHLLSLTAVALVVGLALFGRRLLDRGALAAVDGELLLLLFGLGTSVVLLRGCVFWLLLDTLGCQLSFRRGVGVYAATTAVATVSPGGQAGGTPVNAALVSQSADTEYEEGAAATITVSLLNNLTVVVTGLLAVSVILLDTLGVVPVAGSLLTVAVVGVAVHASPVSGGGFRNVSLGLPVTVDAVESERVHGAVARLTAVVRGTWEAMARLRNVRRRRLVVVGTFSVVAHWITVVALWVALTTTGHSVSFVTLSALIPVAVVGAVLPTSGGVDASLIGLVVVGTEAAPSVAGVGVFAYRLGLTTPAVTAGGTVLLALALVDWLEE